LVIWNGGEAETSLKNLLQKNPLPRFVINRTGTAGLVSLEDKWQQE
jgi:hypothetical protein